MIQIPDHRFKVLYADPPWSYNDKKPRGGAEHHYRTMNTGELAALSVNGRHVSDLASPDCALFLWATWPLLPDAISVIEGWGFEYKTCAFTWVKTTKTGDPFFGLGRYTRGNTEVCLLGTRGKVARASASVRQVMIDEQTVFAQRGRHSAKPPEIRDRIVQLLGDVPRIELFARERVQGWEAWGDQL